MNIVDIFKGIEKLAVQLLLLLIYIPKTLVKIIKSPRWVPDYINEEIDKPNGFKDYSSPILMYLILTVCLFIYLRLNLGLEATILLRESTGKKGIEEFLNSLQGISGAIIGFYFLSVPLYSALIMELFRPTKFSRDNLVRVLYIHCYYYSPLVLIFFGVMFNYNVMLTREYSSLSHFSMHGPLLISNILLILFFYPVLGWFAVNELIFIKQELKWNIWKSIGIMGLGIGIIVAFIYMFVRLNETEIKFDSDGIFEEIEFKLQETGEYGIIINDVQEFDLSLGALGFNNSQSNYPSRGTLRYNEKIIGQLPSYVSNDKSNSLTKKVRQNYSSEWKIRGTLGVNLIISIRPLESQENLLFFVADSSGKKIFDEYADSDSILFKPKYNGLFRVMISRKTNSEELLKYELAVVLENRYLYGENTPQYLKLKKPLKRSITLNQFINDSINYPKAGEIIVGQTIRASGNLYESARWIFNGEANRYYSIILDPIKYYKYSEPSIDVVNSSDVSIFKNWWVPYLIGFFMTLIFGIAFTQSVYKLIKKRNQNKK